MESRDLHHSSIVVGRKGVGKSTYLRKVIADNYPKELKVLVFDVNGSPAYDSFPIIQPNEIKRFRSGRAKLLGTPSMETLMIVARDFRDGLVIFEDCTKYISGNVHPSIKTFLVDHRMYHCDLVFAFHSLTMVPPFFWQMISYCTLFKTAEIFDKTSKKRVPNYETIQKAFDTVKKSKNERFYITVATLV